VPDQLIFGGRNSFPKVVLMVVTAGEVVILFSEVIIRCGHFFT
jgi:hypothetical protein